MVLVEVRLERKRLPAALARVQLEGRVRLHVRAQVGPVGERLAAVRAAERFLARVGAQMSLQQPRPRERLVAHRAAVLEVVSQHVHRQRRHRHVHLPTPQQPVTIPVYNGTAMLSLGAWPRHRRQFSAASYPYRHRTPRPRHHVFDLGFKLNEAKAYEDFLILSVKISSRD